MLVDKPAGPTSHDVVHRVRRAYRTRAAGHTGTLDPFATGLLVVLVGRATRLARFVEAQPKRYLATARLGVSTDTLDATGAVVAESPRGAELAESTVTAALRSLAGEQRQVPPAYSAKRIAGERAYDLARRGETVALDAVPVTVHEIEPVSYRPGELVFRCTVSAGTYVRALARDLGDRLGVGAHLTALRREAIGPLRVDDAVPLAALDEAPPALLPPAAVLRHLPSHRLAAEERARVAHGGAVPAPPELAGDVALCDGDTLVAVAAASDGLLRPTVVLESA